MFVFLIDSFQNSDLVLFFRLFYDNNDRFKNEFT